MTGFRPGWLPTLLVLALLPGLLWLGFWQLERGQQKRELLARQQAQQGVVLTPEQLDGTPEQAYSRVRLEGTFDGEHSFLLDSRTRDGQAGVELLQPFHDRPSGRWVLLNRGWLPWPDRRTPPAFETPAQPLKLVAWVYVSSGTPLLLGKHMAEGWPRLLDHVEVAELWALLGRDGAADELRLEPGPAAYRADWPITNMSPQQHLGYAVQWFALAAALLVLFIYFGIHQARGKSRERHESRHLPR